MNLGREVGSDKLRQIVMVPETDGRKPPNVLRFTCPNIEVSGTSTR
jgi:hypothetical protein